MADARQQHVAGIVLGSYPAKRCPRVVHNDFAPDSPPRPEVSAQTQQLFEDGNRFEQDVVALLRRVLGHRATFIEGGWSAAADATLAAMDRGDEVILNGRLPTSAGRSGAPDVLVRVQSSAGSGYLPIDIKGHKTTGAGKTKTLHYASLDQPSQIQDLVGHSDDGGHWDVDTLQLAHYTRMLQDLGYHPSSSQDAATHHEQSIADHEVAGAHWSWGGIIGTSPYDDVTPYAFGVTWYDLAVHRVTTYSASAPDHRKQRSALERYDHEFAFRLDVAQAARDGRELVRPVATNECLTCIWQEHCTEVAGPDDPSFALPTGYPTVREWDLLATHGYVTIQDLAEMDVEKVLPDFTPHSLRRSPRILLEKLAARARMIRDDIALEPLDDWPEIPGADVEIDFDIEWDSDGRIYLWGLRTRAGQDDATAVYDPAVSFDPLDDDAAAALAEQFADKLEQVLTDADRRGQSVAIYHWHHPEVSRTRQYTRVADLLAGRTVDLRAWMAQNYRARETFSLKDVAPVFGFAWGVEDAGGYNSMAKIDEARGNNEHAHAAQAWCLTYNEADVAAQAAVRDGLVDLPGQ